MLYKKHPDDITLIIDNVSHEPPACYQLLKLHFLIPPAPGQDPLCEDQYHSLTVPPEPPERTKWSSVHQNGMDNPTNTVCN
jgi:hypothetical protein